jgi:putative peptidoglycan lipid II flippase
MQKLWFLVTKKPTSLGSSAIILMTMVIVSGLLGLVRLRVLYGRFTPLETDIFFAAFRIPNLLFEILAMGTLTSAFIPVFTRYITKSQTEEAYKMAGILINITVTIIILISIPVIIWTEPISRLFAPGFSSDQITQMTIFTRSMIIMQVLPLLIGNFFTGMLQSYRLFLVPAIAPVLYNIGMIVGIIFFAPLYGLYGAVIGVGIGAILFMLIQLPLVVSVGYRHHLDFEYKNKGVREIAALIIPRMIGLGASQIDVTVDLMLSSLLGPKMVTVFVLAQSLQQLPVRLFGGTISQAAFPTLSQASAKEDLDNFRESVMSAYRMILFLVIPTSVFFIVLRIPLIRLVFGASRFDWEATVLTALTLSTFSISLFSQAISQVFTRGFYALLDSKTPVIISISTILINTFLSVLFVLVFHFPVWSLGLSTSLASMINAVWLLIILYKKIGGFPVQDLIVQPFKVLFSSLISGILIFIPMKLFDQLVFDTTRVFGLLMLTGITGGMGLVSYLFLSWVMNIKEVYLLTKIIGKLKQLRALLIDPTADILTGETT